MREIRIENECTIEEFVGKVIEKNDENILIRNEDYEKLKKIAQIFSNEDSKKDSRMNFINSYNGYSIETIMKFKKICDEYYCINIITSNGCEIYVNLNW